MGPFMLLSLCTVLPIQSAATFSFQLACGPTSSAFLPARKYDLSRGVFGQWCRPWPPPTCDAVTKTIAKNTRKSRPQTSFACAGKMERSEITDRGSFETRSNCARDTTLSAFSLLASKVFHCLLHSTSKRDALSASLGHHPGEFMSPKGVTNWVDDTSAQELQQYLDGLLLWQDIDGREKDGAFIDEGRAWMHWMKMTPVPLIVELSEELGKAVSSEMDSVMPESMNLDKEAFLSRMGCRLILLPSGAALSKPLETPSGGVTYGKLLYGGVSRFRLLSGGSGQRKTQRRAGERKEIMASPEDKSSSWLQFGGPQRMYLAVDMGPACVLEVSILPPQSTMIPLIDNESYGPVKVSEDMAAVRIPPFFTSLLCHENSVREDGGANMSGEQDAPQQGLLETYIEDPFSVDFERNVGGLRPQIESIVRRVLHGRVLSPDQGEGQSKLTLEAKELASIGLTPVRGLLLYGPSGCGKTLLVREISSFICAREPKIVSAPELLDRWVGGSEKLVRSLFADAEAELSVCNGDPLKSALHVIIIDEIDAVFRRRSATSEGDAGEATRASVVNQILSKLDGVTAIPNTLLIGMTNRRELLDDALLRPGRLEVQIEVGLPDITARREILHVHFRDLRRKGRLSNPLCLAIDGPKAAKRKGWMKLIRGKKAPDLAKLTDGFSGADIAGLVRCAGATALSRSRDEGCGIDGLLITLEDVINALDEVSQ